MRRYHPLLVTLHWLLAVMVIGGLVMGTFALAATPNDDPFKITALTMHMGMGVLILVLMIFRLIVRFATSKPPHADIGNALLNKGAIAAHWVFYFLVIAMCLSGLATANIAGLPAIVFGGSGEPLPANFDDIPPRVAHGIIATLLGLLILAHILAGFYHHYVRKDGLLGRMWYGQRDA
ncbi:cytochrome b [Primorskyibacter sp. S187A]|uniref:cytochrome b n=1 Tax=Primorskyibacter sp. S187A TaxID=3415130 RepID=UPI003C7ACE05